MPFFSNLVIPGCPPCGVIVVPERVTRKLVADGRVCYQFDSRRDSNCEWAPTECDMTSNPAEFRADAAALVIIDTQEKWVPMIPNRHTVVANMRTLIKLARCFEMPIV